MSVPNRASIKEANDHLKKLHQTVFELENKVQMQSMHIEELSRSNRELLQRVVSSDREKDDALQDRDKHISRLERKVRETEELCQKLLEAAQERDAVVLRLERRARLFYEVVQHKSSLDKIVAVLNELSREGGGGGEGFDDLHSQGLDVLSEKLARIRLPSDSGSSLSQQSQGPTLQDTLNQADSATSEHS